MPTRYLSMGDIAEMLGVAHNTIRKYRSEGRLPEPDAMTGPTPGWLPATVEAWQAERPGRGVGGGRPRKIFGALTVPEGAGAVPFEEA